MPVSTAKTQRNAHRVSIRILVWMDLKKFGAVCTLDIIPMSRTIKFFLFRKIPTTLMANKMAPNIK